MALGRGARKYTGSPVKGNRSVVADQAEQKAPAHRAGKCAADIVRPEAGSRCGDALEPPDIGPCGVAARSRATAGGGSGSGWGRVRRPGGRGAGPVPGADFPAAQFPWGRSAERRARPRATPPNDGRAPRTDGVSFRRTTVERTTEWRRTGRAGRQRRTGIVAASGHSTQAPPTNALSRGTTRGCRPRKGPEHVRWGARSGLPLGPAVESGCTSPSDGRRLPRGVAQASPKARSIAGTRWNGQL